MGKNSEKRYVFLEVWEEIRKTFGSISRNGTEEIDEETITISDNTKSLEKEFNERNENRITLPIDGTAKKSFVKRVTPSKNNESIDSIEVESPVQESDEQELDQ